MVYMRNILEAYENLQQDWQVLLNYKSGNQGSIRFDDKVTKQNGDLVVSRYYSKNGARQFLCKSYIDPAEIESIHVQRCELI